MMSDYEEKLQKAREKVTEKQPMRLGMYFDNDIEDIKEELKKTEKNVEDLFNKLKEEGVDINQDLMNKMVKEIGKVHEADNKTIEYMLEGIYEKMAKINPNVKVNPTFKPTFTVPQAKVVTTDPYDNYKVVDSFVPDNQTMHFHGFATRDGKWFILRQSGEDTIAYRYAVPKDNPDMNYSEAWNLREGLVYKRYDEITI